jgi:multidrug resistance efflux pump
MDAERAGASAPAEAPDAEESGPAMRRGRRARVAVGLGVAVLAAVLYWLYARRYEDTDDAQIDAFT